MAIIEVKVPQLSESVAEATLLQWKKKVGEAVAADEILIDVETDKVVLEVPAPSAGVLVEIVASTPPPPPPLLLLPPNPLQPLLLHLWRLLHLPVPAMLVLPCRLRPS
jgi:hypothetical protein